MSRPDNVPPRPPTPRELRKNLKELKALVIQRPFDLDVRLRIARSYRLLSNPDEAVKHYRAVARYLALAGQPLVAIAVAKELLQVNPSHTETLVFLAKLYARTGGGGTRTGRVAVPITEDKTTGGNALGEWPTTPTGIWRAIRATPAGPSPSGAPVAPPPGMPGPESLPPPVPEEDTDDSADNSSDDVSATNALPLPVEAADVVDEMDSAAPEPEHEVAAEDIREEHSNPPAPEPPPAISAAESHKVLPTIPLFSNLDRATFVRLSQALVHRTARAGELLWQEGDDAPYLLIVASGEVVAYRQHSGQRLELAKMGPGEFAGVFALLSERRRTASLQAASDLAYFELHRRVVEELAKEHPFMVQALHGFFRERMVATALSMLPVFRDMEASQRWSLAQRFKTKQYRDGDELVYEGAEVCGMWMILEGNVQVGRESSMGDVKIQQTLVPGHFLGTIAGIEHEQADAAAVAKGEVTTVALTHRAMMDLASAHPELRTVREQLSSEGFAITRHVFGGSAQLPPALSPAFLLAQRML